MKDSDTTTETPSRQNKGRSRTERQDDVDAEPRTIVGIGASAGGLAALRKFFSRVPEDSGLAFVVVVHLAPDQKSLMADLLQPHVKMPVQQVTENTPLRANQVYVIPPNRNLNTIDTHLRLSELEKRRRERAPIDHFFRTLASTHDGDAVAVILTGTGSDGTLGLKEIKGKGGLTVVQDPNEAEYDGMPQSAIATGLVDLVLPLEKIPEEILRIASIKPKIPVVEDENDSAAAVETRRQLQKIFTQIRARTGRDFSRYKLSTITRRIQRRMQLAHKETLQDYADHLRESPAEARALSDDFLITVTSFFRDPHVFERLENDVIPRLFEGKQTGDSVRVWSVGCATGEEAYSIAILLMEEAARRDAPPVLHVFASDLHEHSLQKARDGFYPGDIETEITPERLRRFFVRENGGYRIRKELREIVVFAPHNLLGDPPFSKLDLVSCRNLMIYLQRDVQRLAVDIFHYALKPDGYLLLGSSESLENAELFLTRDKQSGIFRKRNVPAPEPRLPVFPERSGRTALPVPAAVEPEPASYGALHYRIVERYAPPSLLINPACKVVHLSENVGRYLVHPGGEPTSQVFKLLREELRLELRSAVQLARDMRAPGKTEAVRLSIDGVPRMVVMTVKPVVEPDQEGFVLVLFDEFDVSAAQGRRSRPAESQGAQKAVGSRSGEELKTELDLTKQRLQSLAEEYETGQEEMRASNEELQSANEELRSTLEELETSKEELQSINEELQTVNQENRHKVEELDQLSSDLQNLMAATDIATLFLDRELRILRFTPRTSKLFNVRMTDRGRPLSDLTHRLGYPELTRDAEAVLRDLVPIEREVADDEAGYYIARVRPYRSGSDRIDGVVMTFVDITGRKESEARLAKSEEQFRALVSASAQIVWTTNADGTVVEDSPSWRAFTGQTRDEWMGWGWLEAVHPEDRDAAEQTWRECLAAGQPTEFEFRLYNTGKRQYRWVVVRAVPLFESGGVIRGWVGMNTDVSAEKEAQAAERRITEELEARVEQRTCEVRRLASTLTMAEQEERRRISQILHDDLQQLLYGIQLKLSIAASANSDDSQQKASEPLGEANAWIDRAIRTTRQLTVELSPPILKSEGLADALLWLQSQMQDMHGLEVSIESDHPFKIANEDMRVLLFQVVRELLFNVAKHADTDSCNIHLHSTADDLVIDVSDAGCGFDPALVLDESDNSFGLVSIRERLGLFGGRINIESRTNKGTHIAVVMPLQQLDLKLESST